MIGIAISLIILLVIFGIIWLIVAKIPVPAEYLWIVQIILLVMFVLALLDILSGGLSFGSGFHFGRLGCP